ncbi:predicted ATPase related to phosphate starvation-inducible protein PhoH [Moorella thermoacetica Y72]|uniref:Predicted ATPase related to phosphate starvation-inducible protein PhoH n=1 Tax=Moorella thermoacetica Y72 TaxID=1325331 RepID=A0A0S6UAT4_NEOTH|nr:predicted ATPase related to phosphate starvation-inducible protein PhoH [Moorella thermoacetica Y72]
MRKDKQQRDEKQNLPRQAEYCRLYRFAHGLEILRTYDLKTEHKDHAEKHEHRVGSHSGKSDVAFGEYSCDLDWPDTHNQITCYGNAATGEYRLF